MSGQSLSSKHASLHAPSPRAIVLDVDGLTTEFPGRGRPVLAADGISFVVRAGETLALVGESGCGKSMASLAILNLVPKPGKISAGRVVFQGQDILTLAPEAMRKLRGDRIGMIFQEPMTALNPVYTVGEQVAEVLRYHRGMKPAEAMERAVAALAEVGLPDAERRAGYYPHQLSGGQRQRCMIAMALVLEPELVIADEPTTALDVTVAAQVLDLLQALCKKKGAALILITHDLGLVAEYADRVCVLYAGKVVETATVYDLFARASHPYTQGLLAPLRVEADLTNRDARLPVIPGRVPNLDELPPGCAFAERCAHVKAECRAVAPQLKLAVSGVDPANPDAHRFRCVLPAAGGVA